MKNVFMALGCALYVICPLDFDFVPLLGWIDDVALIVYTAYQIKNTSPSLPTSV